MNAAPAQSALAQALKTAGKVLLKHFGKIGFRRKDNSPANLLTAADLESQKVILELIRKRFPDHDYIAEEKKSRRTGSEYLWIIDPLDGTTNYAHGYPAFCISIGVLKNGKPWLAGVYDPFRDECFTARAGRGARLNGKTIRVSSPRKLSDSLLVTGFPYDRNLYSRFYTEHYRVFLTKCHDIRRSGSAALDMAWVAAGRADGFWEYKLKPWDVAAGWLLVSEAGGTVTDFSGEPWLKTDLMGEQTLASNGRIHREMLQVIKKIGPKPTA